MTRPKSSTPAGDKADRDALARLDADLEAFEAHRRPPSPFVGAGAGAGAGYRLLGQLLGGILGGVGLGWLVDRFVHTRPWGVVIGLFLGAALSIVSTVRSASRTDAPSEPRTKGPEPGPRDGVQARDGGEEPQGSKDVKKTDGLY